MLVLTRKVGESVVLEIGGVIVKIMPTVIMGGRVRIGIKAPMDVRVMREELLDKEPIK